MNVIRLDAEDDVFPLRIVSDKAAKAGGVAVGAGQRLPIVTDDVRRNEARLKIAVGAGRTLGSDRAVAHLAADIGALPVDLGAGQAIGEAATEKRQVRHISR